ncbi:MAG: hypothetical protein JO168_10460 [Solirubrobacterales bacterium]|nr:hypothetical protein [Solirubrobacterales bacterium]
MRHIPDGVLRRLDDEPLAVPDKVIDHVSACERCGARRAEIARDTELAARLLSAPQLVHDTDIAWARLRRELHRRPDEEPGRRRRPTSVGRRGTRLPRVSLRTGMVIAALGIVLAGSAVAASLTTVFAPTHVAPLSLSQSDLQSITAFMGLGDRRPLGGFATPSGSTTFRFGTITWSSGPAHPAPSRAAAAAEAGFPVSLPARLPAGVGAVRQFMVQPRANATVKFNSTAASLGGSSVTLDAGPAVVAEYSGATSGTDVPTLGVATMRRPTALSSGASLSQIEAFLLGQPGIPAQLVEEVRLLGDLRTTLPVPVPPGASVHSVQVAGWPGVVLADSSNAAAAVVWEDGRGMLHVVAGLLDTRDVLNVADQLG